MEEIRLQKYIAEAGIASRRNAEQMISDGRVKVNGKTVTELGTKVTDADEVSVDGEVIHKSNKKLYIMLNKPVGYVTTVSDDRDRPTVMELLSDINERVYPVGRLDFNTEGLLLLSNDGDFTYKVTHPKHNLDKTYHVWVTGKAKPNAIRLLENGVVIDGKKTAPAKVDIMETSKSSAVLSITIHEGRNRQVRKMCKEVGFRVIALRRVSEGCLILGNLPLGKWRHLNPNEVSAIVNMATNSEKDV